MNQFNFLYDLLVWLTNNYSSMPDSFQKSFPEERCVDARLNLSLLAHSDSELNEIFKDYE